MATWVWWVPDLRLVRKQLLPQGFSHLFKTESSGEGRDMSKAGNGPSLMFLVPTLSRSWNSSSLAHHPNPTVIQGSG